jgi:hypothetical protein
MEGISENTLSDMMTALADSFMAERKKEEPYKEMFKAGSTHTGLLRKLESDMMGHIIDASEVFSERHGIKLNRGQRNVLLALPFLVKVAEIDAKKNEGLACCVDKAYFMISEQLIALGEKD